MSGDRRPRVANVVPSQEGEPRVIAVVVTHNRRELVLECVSAIRGQTRPPDAVVIVDNASDDGTAAALRERFPQAHTIELARNSGGAGGFAVGLSAALREDAGLVWLMDDDTLPDPDALAMLLATRRDYPGRPPSLLASRVLWTDGRDHPMNTPRQRPWVSRPMRSAAAAVDAKPIRSASFVSILIDAAAARRLGLPRADFFLWNDDFEFTTRLLRYSVGLLCRRSVVTHRTATFGDITKDAGDRFFFEVRNKVWTLAAPGPLGLGERLLYMGATLLRWARTFARSQDRRALGRALVRGLAAGLRTRPRPTAEVLAEFGYPDAPEPPQ